MANGYILVFHTTSASGDYDHPVFDGEQIGCLKVSHDDIQGESWCEVEVEVWDEELPRYSSPQRGISLR